MRRDRSSTLARRGDSWLFTGMGWLIYKKGVYISIYELWMYVIYEKHVCNIYICIYISYYMKTQCRFMSGVSRYVYPSWRCRSCALPDIYYLGRCCMSKSRSCGPSLVAIGSWCHSPNVWSMMPEG